MKKRLYYILLVLLALTIATLLALPGSALPIRDLPFEIM